MPPSYIRVRAVVWAYGRGQTDTHTDARDHNTFCVVYDSRKITVQLFSITQNYRPGSSNRDRDLVNIYMSSY